MQAPQDSNGSTSPKRRRYRDRRPISGRSEFAQAMAPQASSSRPNGETFAEKLRQYGTSPEELMAELDSMYETLRQWKGWERSQPRARSPSVNKDAASNAEDDIYGRIDRIERNVYEIKKVIASLNNVRETNQKIDRIESDVEAMKIELANLNNVRATLAGLQEQLQLLVNTFMLPGQLPGRMYPSAQPHSDV